eukprot:1626446-Heterocapsa_arctica.AAC.1
MGPGLPRGRGRDASSGSTVGKTDTQTGAGSANGREGTGRLERRSRPSSPWSSARSSEQRVQMSGGCAWSHTSQ